jgi:hypothetical protein
MVPDPVEPSGASTGEEAPDIEVERAQFKGLLLQNPNYFGNQEVSPFKPVKVIQGNTRYEELVCIGLDPPYDRLEGVLHLKQNAGYGGDICGPGTREYVRFYVDLFDNGTWHDVGVTSVTVHDIPGRSRSATPSGVISARSESSACLRTSSGSVRSSSGMRPHRPTPHPIHRSGVMSSMLRFKSTLANSCPGAICLRNSKRSPPGSLSPSDRF